METGKRRVISHFRRNMNLITQLVTDISGQHIESLKMGTTACPEMLVTTNQHYLTFYNNQNPKMTLYLMLYINMNWKLCMQCRFYRGADKSLARPTSRCILFDCENISFDASLVLYI